MNKKLMLAFLIFALVIGISALIRLSDDNSEEIETRNEGTYQSSPQNQINNLVQGNANQDNVNIENLNQPNTNIDNTNQVNTGGISLYELASHNSRNDCWIAYDGTVYDITSFLPKHPGSAGAIVPYCGTSSDFENAFSGQHGTSQVSRLFREGELMGDLI